MEEDRISVIYEDIYLAQHSRISRIIVNRYPKKEVDTLRILLFWITMNDDYPSIINLRELERETVNGLTDFYVK